MEVQAKWWKFPMNDKFRLAFYIRIVERQTKWRKEFCFSLYFLFLGGWECRYGNKHNHPFINTISERTQNSKEVQLHLCHFFLHIWWLSFLFLVRNWTALLRILKALRKQVLVNGTKLPLFSLMSISRHFVNHRFFCHGFFSAHLNIYPVALIFPCCFFPESPF